MPIPVTPSMQNSPPPSLQLGYLTLPGAVYNPLSNEGIYFIHLRTRITCDMIILCYTMSIDGNPLLTVPSIHQFELKSNSLEV